MSETESLSDVLGESPFNRAPVQPEVVKTEAAPPAVSEKPAEVIEKQPRAEDGKFASAKVEEKPVEKSVEKPRADVAAIIDERRKRQDAERRLAEALQSKPAEKTSVFTDEDKAISERVSEGTRPLRDLLFKQSVKLARITYKDGYAEAEQAFADAAEKDERLFEGLRNSDDPGEYIYSVGLQIKELADVGGDFAKYREKVTAVTRGELDALKAQFDVLKAENEALKASQSELDSVPRSLNTASSSPSPKASETDDEPISKIVRFGNT
jgi:hypothetical protein